MGKTWEARNTFERVLDIDPNSRLARENLREAIQFLRKQGATEEQLRFHGGSPKFERDGSFKYQHTVKPFPRIPITDIDKPEYAEYKLGRKPLMYTGLYNTRCGAAWLPAPVARSLDDCRSCWLTSRLAARA